MNRGDVVDVELRYGPRPAVIVTADHLIPELSNVTIVEVTSTLREGVTTVLLNRPEHGLDQPSVANAANIQTLPRSRVAGRRGQLSRDEMGRLEDAIKIVLDLEDDDPFAFSVSRPLG